MVEVLKCFGIVLGVLLFIVVGTLLMGMFLWAIGTLFGSWAVPIFYGLMFILVATRMVYLYRNKEDEEEEEEE